MVPGDGGVGRLALAWRQAGARKNCNILLGTEDRVVPSGVIPHEAQRVSGPTVPGADHGPCAVKVSPDTRCASCWMTPLGTLVPRSLSLSPAPLAPSSAPETIPG